jgi:ABC-type multidrug transport system ATPase subunit
MKLIVSLSSLALISFSNVAPSLAAIQSISRSTQPAVSSQASSPVAKPDQVVALNLGNIIRTGSDILNIAEREKRRAEERRLREEREATRKRLQEEAAEARRKATEQQRLEADRRQKYFESLSPEQKEAYIAEQREQQKRKAEVSAALFMMFINAASQPRVCRSGSWLTGYTYHDC